MTARRDVLFGAAAGIAAAAAGLAWWRRQQHAVVDTDPPIDFWSLQLARPEGGELVLAQFRQRPLLINFWATWCAPCVRELPEIDRFAREHAPRGIAAIALAIDGAVPVREFLRRTPLTLPIGLAGTDGSDLLRKFGNHQGGLPFTVLLGADGQVEKRKLGEISHAELIAWTKSLPRH